MRKPSFWAVSRKTVDIENREKNAAANKLWSTVAARIRRETQNTAQIVPTDFSGNDAVNTLWNVQDDDVFAAYPLLRQLGQAELQC